MGSGHADTVQILHVDVRGYAPGRVQLPRTPACMLSFTVNMTVKADTTTVCKLGQICGRSYRLTYL